MIVLGLIVLAGISNAFMDTISLKGGGILPKGSWWSMDKSWRNKWKNGDPKQGEAFPGSTTVFVFATDAWHFFQMIMLSSFALAMALIPHTGIPVIFQTEILDIAVYFFIGKVVFNVPFEMVWRVLNKK